MNKELEYKLILQLIVKTSWEDEKDTCEWLKYMGYKVETINHQESYVRIVGQRNFAEVKPKRVKK
jgi:heme-degrading monooxygenase HmoA